MRKRRGLLFGKHFCTLNARVPLKAPYKIPKLITSKITKVPDSLLIQRRTQTNKINSVSLFAFNILSYSCKMPEKRISCRSIELDFRPQNTKFLLDRIDYTEYYQLSII